jgi:RimJ/RimL family protein N-acetyltransferase/predicted enzyme related to lactoylglutathione lyase
MHKSRLGTVVIDCHGDDAAEAAAFWAQALGWPAQRLADPDDANYRRLETPPGEVTVLVQAVAHPSRVHLDIETDDIEAEVARLERLHARRVAQVKRWWVMEAPTGQRFCVVGPQRPDFAADATAWSGDGTPLERAPAPPASAPFPVPTMPATLHTARLHLRPLRDGDAAPLFALFSDPRVVRFLSRPAWSAIESARQRIAEDKAATASSSYLRLGIELAATGTLIGECSLFNLHPESRRAEIGYALAFDRHGCGYMNEALGALLEHGFGQLQLHRVEADVDPRNEASAQVLQRLGFSKEGHLRERWRVGGERSDSVLYGLLAREWQGRGGDAAGGA